MPDSPAPSMKQYIMLSQKDLCPVYSTGRNAWKIIINKGIGNWGVSGFEAKDDVAELIVPAGKIAEAAQSPIS